MKENACPFVQEEVDPDEIPFYVEEQPIRRQGTSVLLLFGLCVYVVIQINGLRCRG